MIYLKANHKPIRQYHALLGNGLALSEVQENALKQAFRQILESVVREKDYQILAHFLGDQRGYAIVNQYYLPLGYWISVAEADEIDVHAIDQADRQNLMIQAPQKIWLYQHGEWICEADIRDANEFVAVIQAFFAFEPKSIQSWQQIETEYAPKVRQTHRQVSQIIRSERKNNEAFEKRMRHFISLCRQAIRSDLSVRDVDQMLVQHLLTSPLFDLLFKKRDFVRNNAIAQEMEHVLDTISLERYNQVEWVLLYPFYLGIVETYKQLSWRWGQGFIETVYRQFFHYKDETDQANAMLPQPIVQFLVESAADLLKQHFGQNLYDPNVHILDPFLGTGTFLLEALQHIPKRHLARKFQTELHGNEKRLLPYYLASLNIEQEFKNLTKQEENFHGICLVDTFGLSENRQVSLFNPENMERISNQSSLPMHVILGTPPLESIEEPEKQSADAALLPKNAWSLYFQEAKSDALKHINWLKALRWASERVHEQGVIAFFVPNALRFDKNLAPFRQYLLQEFAFIYMLDIGAIPEAADEEMCLLFLVKDAQKLPPARVFLKTLPEYWESAPILHYLEAEKSVKHVDWEELRPDVHGHFPPRGLRTEFNTFLPLWGKDEPHALFRDVFDSTQVAAEENIILGEPELIRTFSHPFVVSWQENTRAKGTHIFPHTESCKNNRMIVYASTGGEFYCNQVNGLPTFANFIGVSFYVYDILGNIRENINDEVLQHFQNVYQDKGIHKWAIFQYVYAILHHPVFREKYRVNLSEAVPRIPLVQQFWRFVEVGKTLSGLHCYFDEIQPHRLMLRRAKDEILRFESLKLNKEKTSFMVDKGCFIEHLPPQSLVYTFQQKAIVEWVMMAYQKEWTKNAAVRQAIEVESALEKEMRLQLLMRHLGQVINVSLETQRLIENMPPLTVCN